MSLTVTVVCQANRALLTNAGNTFDESYGRSGDNWDEQIDPILFGYRVKVQKSTNSRRSNCYTALVLAYPWSWKEWKLRRTNFPMLPQ